MEKRIRSRERKRGKRKKEEGIIRKPRGGIKSRIGKRRMVQCYGGRLKREKEREPKRNEKRRKKGH